MISKDALINIGNKRCAFNIVGKLATVIAFAEQNSFSGSCVNQHVMCRAPIK